MRKQERLLAFFGATQPASVHACMKQGEVNKWLVALFSLSAFTGFFVSEDVSELSMSIRTFRSRSLIISLSLCAPLLPPPAYYTCTVDEMRGRVSSRPHRRTRLERVARKDRTGGEPAGLHRTQERGIVVSWCLPSWCVYAL